MRASLKDKLVEAVRSSAGALLLGRAGDGADGAADDPGGGGGLRVVSSEVRPWAEGGGGGGDGGGGAVRLAVEWEYEGRLRRYCRKGWRERERERVSAQS